MFPLQETVLLNVPLPIIYDGDDVENFTEITMFQSIVLEICPMQPNISMLLHSNLLILYSNSVE